MNNMNPYTALEKAIKHGEIARDMLAKGSDGYRCLDCLVTAAKQLQTVQRENEELRNKSPFTQIREQQVEIHDLKSALKLAGRALSEISYNYNAVDCQRIARKAIKAASEGK